ncbi:MAG: thioredoxin [Oscillospiraceae bacterium]|nr:thioredoxin [Oscillospiraceae bacterium]
MTEITNENFEAEVLGAEPTLVDFYADWCGPCRMLAPTVEELASDYEGKLKVVKANVDNLPEISLRYGIMSIPTLMVFKGGEVMGKMVGVSEYEEIAEMIDNAIEA